MHAEASCKGDNHLCDVPDRDGSVLVGILGILEFNLVDSPGRAGLPEACS